MISRSEMSSSVLPVSVMGSKSLGIGDKRIRRPRTGYFNAAPALPLFQEISQHAVPLAAPRTSHQERLLPQQPGLRPAYLSCRGRAGRHFFESLGKLLHIAITALGPLLYTRGFLLQVLTT